MYPASKVLSYFFSAWHGEARETAELVYILCGADNPKTWIIMRNFRLIPVLIRPGNYLLNLLLGNRQLLSNLIAHAQMNLYTSSAESLSLLRAMPRRNTRGLCSQGDKSAINSEVYIAPPKPLRNINSCHIQSTVIIYY